MGGRIYIGAFNGKLYSLGTKPNGWEGCRDSAK